MDQRETKIVKKLGHIFLLSLQIIDQHYLLYRWYSVLNISKIKKNTYFSFEVWTFFNFLIFIFAHQG